MTAMQRWLLVVGLGCTVIIFLTLSSSPAPAADLPETSLDSPTTISVAEVLAQDPVGEEVKGEAAQAVEEAVEQANNEQQPEEQENNAKNDEHIAIKDTDNDEVDLEAEHAKIDEVYEKIAKNPSMYSNLASVNDSMNMF
jgi:hypothetical protein